MKKLLNTNQEEELKELFSISYDNALDAGKRNGMTTFEAANFAMDDSISRCIKFYDNITEEKEEEIIVKSRKNDRYR